MEALDQDRPPAAAPDEHSARPPQTFTRRIDCAPSPRRPAAPPAGPGDGTAAVHTPGEDA